jgi:hypothetical protein
MTKESTGASQKLEQLFRSSTVVGMNDPQLLEQFVTADHGPAELAFQMIVERHGPMVLRVCQMLLHDVHAAEDAFQATFLVLAKRAGTISSRELLGNWLYDVALCTAGRRGS